MNTPSDALAEPRSGLEVTATTEGSAARRLYWSVRRELWENRSIYLAPLVTAALFLVGFFLGLVGLPERIRAASALGPLQQQEAIQQPYVIVALMLMAVALLVAVFYCVDALFGERRDRSVLFWKSLPVSDLTTVLVKASVPILLLPLVTFAITVVTQLVMLLTSGVVLALSGTSAAPLWTHVPILEVPAINLVHLVGFHGLWYAPFYGWLLLASAWAKRAPFLWAALPPVVIGVVERLALGTSRFATMLQDRAMGGPEPAASEGGMTMAMLASPPLGQFLISPGLWVGLVITAVFLFAATRLRRTRGPI